MSKDEMENLRMLKMNGNTGEVDEHPLPNQERVFDLLRTAPGTPLEKALAQCAFQIEVQNHMQQMSPGCYEMLTSCLASACGSVGPDFGPEQMQALVDIFQQAHEIANGRVELH